MILKIYAIYDKDAESLNERTFTAPNDKVAKRILKQTLKHDSVLAENADRYEVHYCAMYDTESGISGTGKSEKVFELSELLSMPEPAEPAALSE